MSKFQEFQVEHWRSFFPVTEHSVYVNHAACSPVSNRVRSALDRFLDESSTDAVDNYPKWLETRDRLRVLAGQLIHAPESQIAFVKNTSDGLNILASGLDWKPGDRIILADCEFPSNVYPFLNLRKRGVEIDFVKNRDGFLFTEDFEKLITPRTRLLSVSFVEFTNGFRNDLEELGALCRKHGIIFCVDSIQGLGAVPLKVDQFNIDFLSNGGHKWLMAPAGIGFIYVRQQLFNRLSTERVGWLSVKEAWNFFDYKLDLLDDAKRFEMATENWLGVYGLNASLGLLLEAGIEEIHTHIIKLLDILYEGLADMNLIVASSMQPVHRSAILSFRSAHAEETKYIFDSLLKNHIICSYRAGLIRISPHLYNTEEEMRKILMTLRAGLDR